MLVIGIDPGTATTGFGVVRENKDGDLIAVDYGIIQTPTNLDMPERLLELHKKLTVILLLHHPESGAVEKLFFERNIRTALSVGQGRGVCMLALAQAGIKMAEYTPLEVKQAISGYGRADKNQISQMVQAILGLPNQPYPDDASDALAIAICHIHSAKFNTLVEGSA